MALKEHFDNTDTGRLAWLLHVLHGTELGRVGIDWFYDDLTKMRWQVDKAMRKNGDL